MESATQYSRTIRNLTDAIYICDAYGHITLYNKAAVELWGREPEIGKDLFCGSWKLANTDGSDISIESLPMFIAIKEKCFVQGCEIVIHRPDGTSSHVLPCSSPLYNIHGQVDGAVNLMVDISEKRKLCISN